MPTTSTPTAAAATADAVPDRRTDMAAAHLRRERLLRTVEIGHATQARIDQAREWAERQRSAGAMTPDQAAAHMDAAAREALAWQAERIAALPPLPAWAIYTPRPLDPRTELLVARNAQITAAVLEAIRAEGTPAYAELAARAERVAADAHAAYDAAIAALDSAETAAAVAVA